MATSMSSLYTRCNFHLQKSYSCYVRNLSNRRFSTAPGVFLKNRHVAPFIASAAFNPRGFATPKAKTEEPAAALAPQDPNLSLLRQLMSASGVHALIIPSEDPHMSEYPPECYDRRKFISKFSGSAGTAVVTDSAALLWTDGRYFLQAVQELGHEWTLMRAGTPGCPEVEDWLSENLPEGGRVGVDPLVHTIKSLKSVKAKLEVKGKSVVPLLGPNLVDQVWGSARPPAPSTPLRLHPKEWAGETVASKLERVRGAMKEEAADVLLVSMLDQVAWLTNLRGSDAPCNPIFLSYALVHAGSATLYVDSAKIKGGVATRLKEAKVTVKPYDSMLGDVSAAAAAGLKLWLDPAETSYAVYQAATSGEAGKDGTSAVIERTSPINNFKAIKNSAELAGMREAHLRDAVAISAFLMWLEEQLEAGHEVSEVEVDEKLTAMRAAQPGFKDRSFPTIAGADANGAIIHYRAQADKCRQVTPSSMLLLDSGAQFDCGTTDITRTMHFGQPTEYQKRCYTRVLQGHIALDRATFPEGTPGLLLDTLARAPLWREGLNYRHGTGHGVGAALNVHEGPQSISPRTGNTTPLVAGMIVSNEPGYYDDGAFGVRIENLLIVKEVDTDYRFGGIPYLGFEPLTLVPLQLKMVDTSLLNTEELTWLDTYHARVWEAVSPRCAHDTALSQWLWRSTRPLAEQLKSPTKELAVAV